MDDDGSDRWERSLAAACHVFRLMFLACGELKFHPEIKADPVRKPTDQTSTIHAGTSFYHRYLSGLTLGAGA